jgi:hypothetical protein
MKIRIVLSVLMLGAQVAFAGRFDLPKENPQFSIQMPEKWQTEVDGDKVTSRPAKDSKVIISVFPLPGAKNFEDAFALVTEHVTANYRDVKLGKLSEQKQAGMSFYGGQGEAEKDGFELRLSVAAFGENGQRYFGLVWACDEASGEIHIQEIAKTLASIRPFTEQPRNESD